MTDVTFRKMRFDIDKSIPFQWNPANPASGVQANMISFIAVGFERYLVLAVREALETMTDPALREEAEVFIAQEAQHTAAHRKHVNAMIARHPGLRQVLNDVNKAYEELYAAQPLKFHLAYVASLEATFPPLFTFMIEQRERLFHGDSRVASLFLWHYIEEIEHRSSAELIFDGVVGDRLYRLRTLRTSMSHIVGLADLIADGFRAHVPDDEIGVEVDAATKTIWKDEFRSRAPFLRGQRVPSIYAGIPTWRLLKLVGGLMRSQLPNHHTRDVAVPPWYYTWMKSYRDGEDMAHYYGSSA
ncbi:metal-dependent hydrolase [Mycobacterium sp. 236(2023)]|uniref:metal-dependent hydrolase n=1 Tax=Mycobacterium sp. 236(2023) TaxID=3038163 RepID=UPI0024152792|nr:metal-dependent hydrolase [Mycobacterium sp. 236(2023)]MDG4667489.1 metal-dependent hydrolase [Mycobacterium sp. 236(2023)]